MQSFKSFTSFRHTSPTREKRNSCPYAYGALDDDVSLRVPASDALPHFETERIQPLSDGDRSCSPSLRCPNLFTGTRKVQVPFIR